MFPDRSLLCAIDMKKTFLVLTLLSILLFSQARFIPVYIGSAKFLVEVADTREKRIKGLMFRKNIPDDYGMLLVFDDENIQGIWMKNMLVSLDIIFLNKEKQIIEIFYNVPPCKGDPCESYVSKQPAKYVLEIGGNRCRQLGIKPGDTIFFVEN